MNKHLFIVGAQRSATTYLYKILDQHPDIYMAKPMRPEPKFFMSNTPEKLTYEMYKEKYFSASGAVNWLGEKSTSYIESQGAAIAIKQMLPDAKIIIMLRNPVDRAISNYKFSKLNGLEKLSIEEAISSESQREGSINPEKVSVSPFAYKQRGIYVKYIDLWVELFGRENLILLVSENIVGQRDSVQALYQNLQVDDAFLPEGLNDKVNTTDSDTTSPALRRQLQEFFSPWNKELASKYGLDLSRWAEANA